MRRLFEKRNNVKFNDNIPPVHTRAFNSKFPLQEAKTVDEEGNE